MKYGNLTLIEKTIEKNKSGNYIAIWKCDCGNIKKIAFTRVKNGKTKSCGCLQIKNTKQKNSTHKMSNSKEYRIWRSMLNRCYNKSNEAYKYYGLKGIYVCKRWKDSFDNFIKDMGKIPDKSYTIDRINNSDIYKPENCRWASIKTQNRNKSNTIIFNNETAAEASKRLGGCSGLVSKRLKYGWCIEKAFNDPIKK